MKKAGEEEECSWLQVAAVTTGSCLEVARRGRGSSAAPEPSGALTRPPPPPSHPGDFGYPARQASCGATHPNIHSFDTDTLGSFLSLDAVRGASSDVALARGRELWVLKAKATEQTRASLVLSMMEG